MTAVGNLSKSNKKLESKKLKLIKQEWADVVEIDVKNRHVLVGIINDINFLNNKAKMIMDTVLNFSGIQTNGDTFELSKDCSILTRIKTAVPKDE